MSSTNTPHCRSAVEPLWTLTDSPPLDELIFKGQTTTTPDGREEYTASVAGLAPEERMTHWLTVDAAHVVSLEDCR